MEQQSIKLKNSTESDVLNIANSVYISVSFEGYKSKLFITFINDFHWLLKDLSNQKEYFLGFFICNTEVPFLNKQALDPFCKPSLPFSPILHSIFYHHWIIDGWITFRKGHMILGGIWEEKCKTYVFWHMPILHWAKRIARWLWWSGPFQLFYPKSENFQITLGLKSLT